MIIPSLAPILDKSLKKIGSSALLEYCATTWTERRTSEKINNWFLFLLRQGDYSCYNLFLDQTVSHKVRAFAASKAFLGGDLSWLLFEVLNSVPPEGCSLCSELYRMGPILAVQQIYWVFCFIFFANIFIIH